MMMTIAEVPSAHEVDEEKKRRSEKKRRGRAPKPHSSNPNLHTHTPKITTGLHSRASMEDLYGHGIEAEMKRRGAPAAPQYRIMPKGNNSMW